MTNLLSLNRRVRPPSTRRRLRTDTEKLLFLLHRGGNYAHLWTDAGHRSYWFPTRQRPQRPQRGGRKQVQLPLRRVPQQWLRHNVYFSVHPLTRIPPHNTTGNPDRRFISSQSEYIAAINTLFAEFDGKDYVYTLECRGLEYHGIVPGGKQSTTKVEREQALKLAKETLFYEDPERFKARALRHIEALPYPPSIIIDSGGGYHCYWLLRRTVPVDASNRDDLQVIQHGWVQMVDGDPGAADLRRVLRLPGSYNHKAGFGPNPPRVRFIKTAWGLLYDYRQLEEAVNDWLYQRRRARRRQNATIRDAQVSERTSTAEPTALDAVRQAFNQCHRIEDLLLSHGYQRTFAGRGQIRLARPGHNRRQSSITIFPAGANGAPERSVHFSTNDPLYSQESIDEHTGKVRRQTHDAFQIYVMLEHNGDWRAAYHAATAENEQSTMLSCAT